MQIEKFKLNDINRGYLRSLRKDRNMAAEDVSIELGRSKAWLGQIERGLVQTVKKYDLARIMAIYCPEYTPEDIISKGILNNYLNYGFLVEDMDEYLASLQNLDFANILYKCINPLQTSSEKDKTYQDIEYLLKCFNDYPGATTSMLTNARLILFILDNYALLPPDQFFSNFNSFNNKLSNLIREELNRSEELTDEYLKQKKDV